MEIKNNFNKRLMLVLIFLSAVCSICNNGGNILIASNTTKKVIDDKGMSVDDFKKKISNSKKVVLVYFHANWCVPCVKLKPEIIELETKVKDYCEVLKIDTDENSSIADYYEINALPLFVIYKNGIKVWENIGALSKNQLEERIDFYKAK